MKRTTTKYVAMNPSRCMACWKCVDKCPKHVIGKVGFLWHKHAVFKDADACIGCNKCIKTCPHGVFFRPNETSIRSFQIRTKMKTAFIMERLLPLAFVATAVTGIGLHIAGHGSDHEIWHNWAASHVISSLIWLVSGVFHIKRHWNWYRAIISKGIGKRSWMTLVLSVTFVIVVITGIVLIVCVDGANSATGLWHYKFGLLLIVFSIIHILNRTKRI